MPSTDMGGCIFSATLWQLYIHKTYTQIVHAMQYWLKVTKYISQKRTETVLFNCSFGGCAVCTGLQPRFNLSFGYNGEDSKLCRNATMISIDSFRNR